ncbi:hypothetical protein NPIL_250151 [Nephila pilipes]|uniref:Uncharacterized protein n=1 Tax=Nephila pilipes TaxID=299642 RepID=A0A8X6NIS4_NEPPI|nr:hypothetical protein NPIL_250151 [Nephila pilipes]
MSVQNQDSNIAYHIANVKLYIKRIKDDLELTFNLIVFDSTFKYSPHPPYKGFAGPDDRGPDWFANLVFMTGKDPEREGGTPCIKDRDVLQRINKELSGGLGKESRDHCFLSPLIYGSNLGRGSVIGGLG